jgi:hemerythrin-like metal-binding protein
MEREDLFNQAKQSLCDVGIEKFNQDHIEIFYNILLLQESLQEVSTQDQVEENWETLWAFVEKLGQLTSAHLEVEEALMQASNYANYPAHKIKHEKITAQFQGLKDKIKNNRLLTDIVELHDFMLAWIFQHTSTIDMEYKGKLDVSKLQVD